MCSNTPSNQFVCESWVRKKFSFDLGKRFREKALSFAVVPAISSTAQQLKKKAFGFWSVQWIKFTSLHFDFDLIIRQKYSHKIPAFFKQSRRGLSVPT